ncbi:MAG: glycerol-3-phosphate acyltransferase [Candidatus Cloacimonadaceae bacterium]
MVLTAVLIILLSYFYGGFSTARILAKSFHALNIYKVGTGLADTENIYFNVSKPLGILTGALDAVKSYSFLFFVSLLLSYMNKIPFPPDLSILYSTDFLMLYGLAMLIGHCLPLRQQFRGGRGIFTYFGIMLLLTPIPALLTGLLALVLIIGFKQIRFAQYTIVIMPVLLTLVCSSIPFCSMLAPHFATGSLFTTRLLGMALAMGILNYFVSKKLGEF